MTIPANRITEVPISRVLALCGLRGHWLFGTTFVAPSPRASAKRQRSHIDDLRVTKGGWWRDTATGKGGDSGVSLLAYCSYVGTAEAERRMCRDLTEADLMLDQVVRRTPRSSPYDRSKRKVASVRGEAQQFDDQLRKFVARPVAAKLKADALVQAAWNASAADRSGR